MDMNEKESEKTWFDLVDHLEEEHCGHIWTLLEPADSPALDKETMQRMKMDTFHRLGLPAPETERRGAKSAVSPDALPEAAADCHARRLPATRRRFSVMTVWAVVSIIIIAASLIAVSLPEVRAQLLKAFQFIPGFASVQDTETHGIQYAISEPLVVQDGRGHGEIEIRGLMIGRNLAYATLTGNGGAHEVQKLMLRNTDGTEYTLQRAHLVRGTDWQSNYYTYDKVEVSETMLLWIDGTEGPYSLRLVEAKSAASIDAFGASDAHGGIGLTAVSQEMDDGRTKISLISRLPLRTKINSYGLQSFDLHKTVLLDLQENEIPIAQDAVFPNPNEFYFKRDSVNTAGYRLVIPELGIVRQFEKPFKMKLPVPDEAGETVEVNRTVQIFGHPVTVLRIKRMDPDPGNELAGRRSLLQIDFDMHFDPVAEESLLLLNLDYTAYPNSSGSSLKFNEQTGAMAFMTVDIAKSAKSYTMILKDASLAVRGPWEFRLP